MRILQGLRDGLKWILSETGTSALGHIVAEKVIQPAIETGGVRILGQLTDRREYESRRASPVESALGLYLIAREPEIADCLYDGQGGNFNSSDRQRLWACHTFEAIFYDSKEALILTGEKIKPKAEEEAPGRVKPVVERANEGATPKIVGLGFSGRPIVELVKDVEFIEKRLGPHLNEWREHAFSLETFDRAIKAVSEDPVRGFMEKGRSVVIALREAVSQLPSGLASLGIMTNEERERPEDPTERVEQDKNNPTRPAGR